MTPAQEIAARYGASVSPDLNYQVIPMGVRGLSYEYVYNPATAKLEPTEATRRDNEMLIKGSAALGRKKAKVKEVEPRISRAEEQRRRRDEVVAVLRSLAERGMTRIEAATASGIGIYTINSLSGLHGIQFKPKVKEVRQAATERSGGIKVRAEISRLHAAGKTDAEISQEIGRARRYVSQVRIQLGLPLIAVAGKLRARAPKKDPVAMVAKIIDLHNAGMAPEAIAREASFSRTTVDRVLKNAGIKPRLASEASRMVREPEVRRLRGIGMSLAQIARTLKASPNTISADLEAFGLIGTLDDVPQEKKVRIEKLIALRKSVTEICRLTGVRRVFVEQMMQASK